MSGDKRPRRSMAVLHEVMFLLTLVAGGYLLISLVSNSPLDGKFSSDVPSGEILNEGGPVGAKISYVLLLTFGYSAYFSVASFIGAVLLVLSSILRHSMRVSWLASAVAGLALLLVCTSSIEALRFAGNTDILPDQRSGGILGQSVAKPLYNLFGFHGATLILLGFWFSGFSLFANFTWTAVFDKFGEILEHAEMLACAVLRKSWRAWGVVRGWTTPVQEDRSSQHPGRFASQSSVENDSRGKERSWSDLLFLRFFGSKRKSSIIGKAGKEPSLSNREESDKNSRYGIGTFADAKSETLRSTSLRVSRSLGKAVLPSPKLLSSATPDSVLVTDDELKKIALLIEAKLAEFGVQASVTEIQPGPVVTRFEIEPATGVKGAQIVNLVRELARALAVQSIRILETIPGKKTMGIEVPNPERATVHLREIISSSEFTDSPSPVTLALGRDIAGKPVAADLLEMPHLLVAGTTGSGKSVQINSMILSILFKATPEQVRLILIDPKVVELAAFDGLPHLYAPVVTDMANVPGVLLWCVAEMERRYKLMAKHGARNLAGLNAALANTQITAAGAAPAVEAQEQLPLIVMIIDELADLMAVVGKKVELLINRLAQKARASGIHLVLATQRPSVDVITGLIKANIPSRIAFQVSSKIDSRTILDQSGAETLLGKGDMLYLPGGISVPERVHGAYVNSAEVQKVVAHIIGQTDMSKYEKIEFSLPSENTGAFSLENLSGDGEDGEDGKMYRNAVEIVLSNRRASISLVQRHLRIGYNRAARIIEQMERNGIVSPMDSNGTRKILSSGNKDN